MTNAKLGKKKTLFHTTVRSEMIGYKKTSQRFLFHLIITCCSDKGFDKVTSKAHDQGSPQSLVRNYEGGAK